jgi:hypothetical protein
VHIYPNDTYAQVSARSIMAAGADSINDMDLLRDGAMETVFSGVRAPSTLGSHLRSYTWSSVRQLDKAHRGHLTALAEDVHLLPGRETLTFIGIDSTRKRVYGYGKEGAAFGHAKVAGKNLLVKGLNALISVISTPLAAPVRLRGGNAGSARGAAGLWPRHRRGGGVATLRTFSGRAVSG